MSKEELAYESALESGAVKRTDSKWNPLSDKAVELDQKELDKMSVEEIKMLGRALDKEGVLTPDLEKQLSETALFNMNKQMKKPGNVGTALSADPMPMSVNQAPSSVSGSVQTNAQLSGEMYTAQESLNQSQSNKNQPPAVIVGGSDNSTVNNTTMNTFTSPAPPSSRDYYDYNTAFKQTR